MTEEDDEDIMKKENRRAVDWVNHWQAKFERENRIFKFETIR